MLKFETLDDNIIKVTAPEKLKADDLVQAAPVAEGLLGKLDRPKLLVDASAFDGWEDMAALEKHAGFVRDNQGKIDRIAFIAKHEWQHWLLAAVGVFLHPQVKVFRPGEDALAEQWLRETPKA